MASQMAELNRQSRIAGYASLGLEFIAFWVFPPGQSGPRLFEDAGESVLRQRVWRYWGIRLVFLAVSTVVVLLSYILVGWILGKLHAHQRAGLLTTNHSPLTTSSLSLYIRLLKIC
jgi:hypothetical protein